MTRQASLSKPHLLPKPPKTGAICRFMMCLSISLDWFGVYTVMATTLDQDFVGSFQELQNPNHTQNKSRNDVAAFLIKVYDHGTCSLVSTLLRFKTCHKSNPSRCRAYEHYTGADVGARPHRAVARGRPGQSLHRLATRATASPSPSHSASRPLTAAPCLTALHRTPRAI